MRYWIWTFGEIDGYRWVIDKKKMAFSESQMRGKALNMAPGDKAILYVSRGAFHNPTRDKTRLAGVVELKEAPKKAKAVEVAGKSCNHFLKYKVEKLFPERDGPELAPLIESLERVEKPKSWGNYFRSSPIEISEKDFRTLEQAIAEFQAEDPELKGETKELAKSLKWKDLKSGDWFSKLVVLALKTYRTRITAEFFQEKYEGLPPDAIADRRIEAARHHAALEGAASGGAYSAAVLATLGSKGGASPFTVPAAVSTFAFDLTYVSSLQLRLAYDLSVIYGRPLDPEDPEDMTDILSVAFGVKATESFQHGLQKVAPEMTRVAIKKSVSGVRLDWLKALPFVGKYLFQRSFIKLGIPVVAVGMGYYLNRLSTDLVGKRAKRMLRGRPLIEEKAREFQVEVSDVAEALLLAIWYVIRADGETTRQEAWFLKALRDELAADDQLGGVLDSFGGQLTVDGTQLEKKLRKLPMIHRHQIIEACYVAAATDGRINKKEQAAILELATACKVALDQDRLSALTGDLM